MIRRADPTARRQALWILAIGVMIGALLIVNRVVLIEWLASDHREFPRRLTLVLAGVAVLYVVPLVACAIYIWTLGTRAVRTREFPPKRMRVLRDTRVVVGRAAIARGRVAQALALALAGAALVLALSLWRLASVFAGRAMP
jgi:uncharacterized membrane protein YqjE